VTFSSDVWVEGRVGFPGSEDEFGPVERGRSGDRDE